MMVSDIIYFVSSKKIEETVLSNRNRNHKTIKCLSKMSATDYYKNNRSLCNGQLQLQQSMANQIYTLPRRKDQDGVFFCNCKRDIQIRFRLFILLWPFFWFIICNCLTYTIALEIQPSTKRNDGIVSVPTLNGLEAGDDNDNTTPYAEESSTTTDDSTNPSEIQKAVCTVTAGEVRASAEAVTTKILHGVCGTAEMNLAFHNLESKLHKELQEIKQLLQLNLKNGNIVPVSVPQADETTVQLVETTLANTLKLQPITSPEHFNKATRKVEPVKNTPPITFGDLTKTPATPQLKSLQTTNAQPRHKLAQREQEVSKFNNTLLSDSDFKMFTYYWKLENLTSRIELGESATLDSPIFSIKGKALHIRAFFQHLHRDFLYLQLTYATLKQSNRNNIILDTGSLFKQINSDKMSFKHKISILDQYNHRVKDLVSPEFNNLETSGFLIPNSALLASHYVKHNSLLIQIFLYL